MLRVGRVGVAVVIAGAALGLLGTSESTYAENCLSSTDFFVDLEQPIDGTCAVQVTGFRDNVLFAFLDLELFGDEGSLLAVTGGEEYYSESMDLLVVTGDSRRVTLNVTAAVREAATRGESSCRIVLDASINGVESSYSLSRLDDCWGVFRSYSLVDGVVVPDKRAVVKESDDSVSTTANETFRAGPNPANPSVTFTIRAGTSGTVEVLLYDIRGREVRRLQGTGNEGEWVAIQWDGVDSFGKSVASSTYLYRVRSDGIFHGAGKVSIVR